MNTHPSVVINFNLLQGYVYVSRLPPSVCFLLLSTLVRITNDGVFLKEHLKWLEGNGDKVSTALDLEKEEIQSLSPTENLEHKPIMFDEKGSHGNN